MPFDIDSYFAKRAATTNTVDNKVGDDITAAKENALAQASAEKVDILGNMIQRHEARRAARELNKGLDSWVGGGFGADSDIARKAWGGALRGVGSAAGFVGDVIDHGGRAVAKGYSKLSGQELAESNGPQGLAAGFQSLEDWLHSGADALDQQISSSDEQEMLHNIPTGRWNDPLSWSLGEDPSIKGYALHLAEIVGQLSTQGPMAATKAPMLAGAIMSGLQAGGSQAREAEKYLNALNHEELLEASGMYRDLIADGMDQEQARARVIRASSGAAALGGFSLGSAGGALTSYILGPLQRFLNGNVLSRIGKSVGIDSLAEGSQELAETVTARTAANLAIAGNRDVNEDTFGDLLLGSIGGSATGVLGGVSGEIARNRENAAIVDKKKREVKEALTVAAETGDFSALLNPESNTYNLREGLNRLIEVSSNEGTSPEVRKSLIDQAVAAIALAQKELEAARESAALGTPEGKQAFEETTAAYEARLGDESVNQEALQRVIDARKEELAIAEKRTEKDQKAREAKVKEYEELIERAEATVTKLGMHSTTESSIEQDIQAAASDPAAAERVITLAMMSPDMLSDDHLQQLESVDLSPEHRTFLRTLSAARQSANQLKTMSHVNRNVLKGGDDYVGLEQHQRSFQAALASGDQVMAQRALKRLERFTTVHGSKADAVAKAYDEIKDKTGSIFLTPNADGLWVRTKPMSREQQKATGSQRIHRNSAEIVDTIQAEAQALRDALAASQQSFALAFNQPFPAATTPAATSQTAEPENVSTSTPVRTDVPTQAQEPTTAETATPTESSTEQGPSLDDELRAAVQARLREEDEAAAAQAAAETETESQSEPTAETVEEATEDAIEASEPEAATEATVTDADTDPSPTESVAETEVAAEPETDATPDAAAAESGKLRLFDGFKRITRDAWKAADYTTTNLIAQFFDQIPHREDGSQLKPLALVRDFAARIRNGEFDVWDFLPVSKMTEEQQVAQQFAIDSFMRMDEEWDTALNELLKYRGDDPKKRAYFFRSPHQYFFDEHGDTDANFRTALKYSLFSWVAEQAAEPVNSDRTINGILGARADAPVSPEAFALLGRAGQREHIVQNTLGQRALQVLGLRATKDIPISLQPLVEADLGGIIMALGVDLGLIERHEILGKDLSPLMQQARNGDSLDENTGPDGVTIEKPGKNELSTLFLRVNPNPRTNHGVNQIKTAAFGSQNIVDRLFGGTPRRTEPSLQPIPFTQKTFSRTPQPLPKYVQRIQEGEQRRPMKLRKDAVTVLEALGAERVKYAGGVVNLDGERPIHISRRSSQESKNDNIARQVDDAFNYFKKLRSFGLDGDSLFNQGLFFPRDVWSMGRVGMASHILNPQQSKIHRAILTMDGWETTVKMDDSDGSLTEFKRAVAQNLGIAIDKMNIEKSLEALTVENREGSLQKAAEDIRRLLYEPGTELTDAEKDNIAQQMRDREEVMTLNALIGMADFRQAHKTKSPSFTTRVVAGVDGVANGPNIIQMMLGALNAVTGERGGFFTKESGITDYPVWRGTPGNLDLYESSAIALNEGIQSVLQEKPNHKETVEIIGRIGGPLTEGTSVSKYGRNIVKTPLTALFFGSSLKSAIRGMTDDFIDNVFDRIEKAVESGDQKLLNLIYKDLNTLIKKGYDPTDEAARLHTPTLDNALIAPIQPAQVRAIQRAYARTVGKGMEAALEANFGKFLARRKRINQALNLQFTIFNTLFESAKAKKLKELMDSGEIPVRTLKDGTKEPLHDLQQYHIDEILKALNDMKPVLQTAMSEIEGNKETGLWLPKDDRKLGADYAYQSEIALGKPIRNTLAESGSQLKESVSNIRTSAFSSTLVAPGVRGGPLSAHNLDSQISMSVYAHRPALNNHDEHMVGAGMLSEQARLLNKATWDTLLDYSQPRAAYQLLAETLLAADTYVREHGDTELLTNLNKALEKYADDVLKADQDFVSDNNILGFVLKASFGVANAADSNRLSYMATLGAVNQYGYEGGAYLVTDNDRKAATEKLEALPKAIDPAIIDAANNLHAAIGLVAIEAVNAENEGTVSLGELEAVEQTLQSDELSADDKELLTGIRDRILQDKTSLTSAARKAAPEEVVAPVLEQVRTHVDTNGNHPLGKLGQPRFPVDAELEAFVRDTPNLNAQTLARKLYQHMRKYMGNKPTRIQQAMLEILTEVGKLTSPDTQVHYVTADTDPSTVLGENISKARGWYAEKGSRKAIYLKSSEFQDAGINTELVLHELIHSVVSGVVEDALADKNHPARPMVDELVNLLQQAQAKIDESPELQEEFGPAVANVHELIAWGMSNAPFQRQVLNELEVATSSSDNTLIKGMKKFIRTLLGILYKGSGKSMTDLRHNGLAVLIQNVSGLFAAEAQQKERELTLRQDSPDPINKLTTTQVFDALASLGNPVTGPLANRLKGLLEQVVHSVHGPYGALFAERAADAPKNPVDRFMHTLATGNRPFVSKVASNFKLRPQVAYVLEQVEAAIHTSLSDRKTSADTALVQKHLRRIWNEARQVLTPQHFYEVFTGGDWNTATAEEQRIAQEQHRFVFTFETDADGESRTLSQFAAMAVTMPEFTELLASQTYQNRKNWRDLDWPNRIRKVVDSVLAILFRRMAAVYENQSSDQQALALVDQLVAIDARRKKLLNRKTDGIGTRVEDLTANLSEAARNRILKIAESDMLQNSRKPLVRAISGITALAAGDRLDQLEKVGRKVRDRMVKAKPGVVMGLINEIKGESHELTLLSLFSNGIQQDRKKHKEVTIKASREAFGDQEISEEQSSHLTKAFLRTDLSVFVDKLSLSQIDTLLRDNQVLNREIHQREQQLSQFQHGEFYIRMSRDLGYTMSTGRLANPLELFNAQAIANLVGTQVQPNKAEATQAEAIIDELTSLYAVKYAPTQSRKQASEVLRTQMQREDGGNGVEYLLRFHKRKQAESKEKLFKDSELLFRKGYVPELYSDTTDIQSVTADEIPKLLNEGWELVRKLPQDKADPTEQRFLMVNRDGGLNPHDSGAISLTGTRARGSQVHSGLYNHQSDSPHVRNRRTHATIEARKQAAIRDLFTLQPGYDPSKVDEVFMAPVLNANGEIVNWRYVMDEVTKDTLLERNNDVFEVLGQLEASIVDKVKSSEQNRKVVKALKQQFEAEGTRDPDSYLEISPNSKDPVLRSLWHRMPSDTKLAAKEAFGRSAMMVRTDHLYPVFGYRHIALSDAFNKLSRKEAAELRKQGIDPTDPVRNIAEDFMVSMLTSVLPKGQAQRLTRNVGKFWDELVRLTKDILVIRTGTTLFWNVVSNAFQLWWAGVPMSEIYRTGRLAITNAIAYQKDHKELIELENRMAMGYHQGRIPEIENRIAELKNSLAVNPVRELIEAGLMPTIVEDISMEQDPNSYMARLANQMKPITDRLPTVLVQAAKVVTVSQDTKLYKFFSDGTQFSDFAARYTFFQHATTRKRNPLSQEEAIVQASNMFVNYDIPSHPVIQYLNKKGGLFFTKYYLRIQRVLLNQWKENPLRGLAIVLLDQYLDGIQTIMDSLPSLGNPFRWGPLELIGALDDPLPVKGLMNMVD